MVYANRLHHIIAFQRIQRCDGCVVPESKVFDFLLLYDSGGKTMPLHVVVNVFEGKISEFCTISFQYYVYERF